jgi:transposase
VLLDHGVTMVKVDRPDGGTRRQRGKPDPMDAEAAARAVLAGVATEAPKRRDGILESIRALGQRPQRRGQGAHRGHQLAQGTLVTAPARWPEALDGRATPTLVAAWARLRPDQTALADPVQGSKAALAVVAQRIRLLDQGITLADQRLATLIRGAAPRLLQLLAIGTDHAGAGTSS